jgi:First Longin domain of INTU, CCZ1 and HPS4
MIDAVQSASRNPALMATSPGTPSKGASAKPSSSFLSSLYIYNPSLGQTDHTVHEQLIFHYSPSDVPSPPSNLDSHELDKKLRAIGLAQGIVEFARAFSPNSPLQEIRTQKGFTVPIEVEKSWWMLAVRLFLTFSL